MADAADEDGERDDRKRELGELREELRLLLPGATVLFAFLLTLPFTPRFATVSGRQRAVYFAAFLGTALAVALLSAPAAYHRLLWSRHVEERRLVAANRLAIAGTILLALAMTRLVFLIADVLFGVAASAAISLALGGRSPGCGMGSPCGIADVAKGGPCGGCPVRGDDQGGRCAA